MYRVKLTDERREELNRRAREPGVMPRTRDRLEMVRLSDAGWSIPRIAPHLNVSEVRVRYWIKQFLGSGFDALPDRPHVGQSSSVTPAMLAALRRELARGERAWSAAQIAAWLLEEYGVRVSADWLSRLLKREKLSYKRTSRSLKHKQDPREVRLKAVELETLERGAMPA